MAVTQAEVLELFTQVAAIKNSDQILMITANQDGSVSATKITAELLRAYINRGFDLTIGEDGYIYIGDTRTNMSAVSIPMVEQTDTTLQIDPNVLNKWGTVNSLGIGFTAGASGRANEYMMEFTVGSDAFTLTLPSGIRWVEEPEWENGLTYQVSVLNGLAIYADWEAAAT